MKEIAEIRRALSKQDVTYRIVKNRLMRIAAQDTIGDALSPLLIGPTAIAFGNDESATAKAVLDATRPYRVVTITGAVLGDRAISADGVKSLASLPSREVLLGKLAGGMQAPIATLAGLLTANIRNLGYGAGPGPRPEGPGRGRVTAPQRRPITTLPPTRRPPKGDQTWQSSPRTTFSRRSTR